MNRIVTTAGAVGVAATLLLGVAACSSPTGTPSNAGAAKPLTIAFVMGAEADPFFKAMKVGAEAATQANKATLVWQGDPSVYSPATQIPIVDQVLAQKPSCLVLISTDPTASRLRRPRQRPRGFPSSTSTLTWAISRTLSPLSPVTTRRVARPQPMP